MVDRDGLRDLEEPNQLEPVQALGAGLIAMNPGQPGLEGLIGADKAVNVRESEVAADGVHARDHRGVHEAALAKLADVQLDMSSLDRYQRVESVCYHTR